MKHNCRINKDGTIRDIRPLFETNKETEERKKKKQNEKIVKDNIIRGIRILFEQEKNIIMSLKGEYCLE